MTLIYAKLKHCWSKFCKTTAGYCNEPAPVVAVNALADSAVNLVVRPWVESANYWPVYWDTLENIKLTFDREGIEIPFPQMSLHMKKEDKA